MSTAQLISAGHRRRRLEIADNAGLDNVELDMTNRTITDQTMTDVRANFAGDALNNISHLPIANIFVININLLGGAVV